MGFLVGDLNLRVLMRNLILIALLLIMFGAPARAQGWVRSFDPTFWDGDRQVLIYQNATRTHRAQVLSREGKLLANIKAPDPFQRSAENPDFFHPGFIDYADGTFYCFQKGPVQQGKEGPRMDCRLLAWDGSAWQLVAKGSFPGAGPSCLWRLGNGKFLGAALGKGVFVSMGRSYPFAILRVTEAQRLEVESGLDLGLEKPQFQGEQGPTYRALTFTFLVNAFTRTSNRIVYASPLGLFWLFDSETGALKRVARLYGGLEDSMLDGKTPLLEGLLGFGVRPDDQILVSARTEEAVLTTRKMLAYPSASDAQGKQSIDFGHRFYPFIDWWLLDPETGKFTLEAPPMNFPSTIKDEQAYRNFNWRFQPDGVNLQLIDFKSMLGKARSD